MKKKNIYTVEIAGFTKKTGDYTRELGSKEIQATSDEQAIRLFNRTDWLAPEGGSQRFTLLVHREGPQGDAQALAERHFHAFWTD